MLGEAVIPGADRPGGASCSEPVVGGRSVETSDTDSQPPLRAQPTRAGGHQTLAERMRAKAAKGELLDRGEGPFDLAAMQRWGKERTVSAAVLRDLLVGERWLVHAKGVRLRGVRISGS